MKKLFILFSLFLLVSCEVKPDLPSNKVIVYDDTLNIQSDNTIPKIDIDYFTRYTYLKCSREYPTDFKSDSVFIYRLDKCVIVILGYTCISEYSDKVKMVGKIEFDSTTKEVSNETYTEVLE